MLYSRLKGLQCQSEVDKEGLSSLLQNDDCYCTIIELSEERPLAGSETGSLGGAQSCVLTHQIGED